jgi:hypothetical protein
MEDMEVDSRVIDAVTNHVSGTKAGIVGVYQTSKHQRKRRVALSAWEEALLEILAGGEWPGAEDEEEDLPEAA